MSDKLGFGIVGLGQRAERHAESISRLNGCYLAAVCSRKLDKAAEFASRHGSPKIYDEVEYLLDDEQVDVVVLSTPNSLHLQHAAMIAKTGKSLIIECPLETSLERVVKLLSIAEDEGVFISSPAEVIFSDECINAKAAIDDGRLGKVRSGKLDIFPHSDIYNRASSWKCNPELSGGRIDILDSYSEMLLLCHLFGPVTKLDKINDSSYRAHFDRDTSIEINFKAPDGLRHSKLSISGDKGAVSISSDTFKARKGNRNDLDSFYGSYISSLEDGIDMMIGSDLIFNGTKLLNLL